MSKAKVVAPPVREVILVPSKNRPKQSKYRAMTQTPELVRNDSSSTISSNDDSSVNSLVEFFVHCYGCCGEDMDEPRCSEGMALRPHQIPLPRGAPLQTALSDGRSMGGTNSIVSRSSHDSRKKRMMQLGIWEGDEKHKKSLEHKGDEEAEHETFDVNSGYSSIYGHASRALSTATRSGKAQDSEAFAL